MVAVFNERTCSTFFFRAYHKKHNIPLWNKAAIPDEIEKKIDYEFLEKMRGETHIVFDTHYGGWFGKDIADLFRILLICDKDVATKRILGREHTHKETPAEIDKRRDQIRAKFKKLYSGEDYEDPKLFNLVIDTTATDANETLTIALAAVTA